jgi:hypothetical protein
MLDHFLERALAKQAKDDTRQEMVDAFMQFPDDELHKIATGRVKLSCMMEDGDNDWLGKFDGTPLYDQALALEEEKLELDVQAQQQRLAENEERRAKSQERDSVWDAKDAIRLKKRLLELELRKSQLGGGEEEEPELEEEMEAEGPEPPEPEEGEVPEAEEEPAPEKLGAVEVLYQQRQQMLRSKGELMKAAAEGMDPSRAYQLTEDELMDAASGGGKMKKMRARAAEGMGRTQQDLQGYADFAAEHPVAHRVPGGILGGTAGGLGGAALGHAIKPGLGTAIGGLGGAALGGAAGYYGTPSPEAKAQSAQEYAQAAELMGDKKTLKSGLRKALLEHAMQTDEMGAPLNPEAVEALRKHVAPKMASVMAKQAGTWKDTSPYFWGHSALNPLPGSGYGAAAGGLMADEADTSPALKGALMGGGMGGAVYGLGALRTIRDPRAAALVGGIGALGGATGGAHAGKAVSKKMKERAKKKESMVKVAHSALEKCAAEKYDELTGHEEYAIWKMAEAAGARMEAGLAFDDLEDFEKVAILGAIGKGLAGAGKFLRGSAKGVKNVYQKGAKGTKGGWSGGGRSGAQTWTEGAAGSRGQGLKNVGSYLKHRVGTGAKRVGRFAVDNPGAAAAMGGAGLATAGGIGYAAG